MGLAKMSMDIMDIMVYPIDPAAHIDRGGLALFYERERNAAADPPGVICRKIHFIGGGCNE